MKKSGALREEAGTVGRLPRYGGIAQLGERLLCKQEVNGSIPFISTSRQIACRDGYSGLKNTDSLEAGGIWAYSSAG